MEIIGEKIGKWTVLGNGEKSKSGHATVYCKCECGVSKNVQKRLITSGKSKSCGCGWKGPRVDLTGKKFGRILVESFSHMKGNSYWNCVCDCGTRKKIKGSSLKSGGIVSCGCYGKEEASKRMKIHGHSIGMKTDEYKVWAKMRARCYNDGSTGYHNYGGRGIRVCAEWENYVNFYNDMGKRPSKLHSIDRIDNDGDYSAGNCKWSTKKEQANNRRTNVYYEYNGVSMNLTQWEEITGIKYATLYRRIHTMKWSLDKSFTEPLRYT